ncbi:hypothetical protein UK82_16995 [Frankia sp. ACN1ag]|nr:hypothetical protein UK82_16995 [Frankia sp. ACN1ag]
MLVAVAAIAERGGDGSVFGVDAWERDHQPRRRGDRDTVPRNTLINEADIGQQPSPERQGSSRNHHDP